MFYPQPNYHVNHALYIKPLHKKTRWAFRADDCVSSFMRVIHFALRPQEWKNAKPLRLCALFFKVKNRFFGATARVQLITLAIVICALVALRYILMGIGTQTASHIIAESLRRQSRIEELSRNGKDRDALALIDDSLEFLQRAPRRLSDAQAEALETMRLSLLKSASRITKLSIIANPVPVVSMEKSFREARRFNLNGLALAAGKLYTVNTAEKEIYELDGREHRIVVLSDLPQGAGTPVGIVTAPPGIVHVLTENPLGILALDPRTRMFTFTPVVLPRPDTIALAWSFYHDRLYLLDARSRAIYRYEKTEHGGYNLWSPWTGENALDLSQATALSVDGAIYVAFNDQHVVRLVQGKETAFPIERIRPPLQQITTIATKEESPLLYLLDAPQRRVVVVSKEDGALIAQYMSPGFTNLRGIYPDETARRIYLLNGDTVYSVGPDDANQISGNL